MGNKMTRSSGPLSGFREWLIICVFLTLLAVAVSGCSSKVTKQSIVTQQTSEPKASSATSTSVDLPATTTTSATTTTTLPQVKAAFDVDRALKYTKAITDFGPRVEGGKSERAAADYAEKVLTDMGYTVQRQEFILPTKKPCQNLIVDIPGAKQPEKIFVVGGHIDSIWKTLGANDDALGVGIVLELAQYFKAQAPPVTLRLMVFGAEEYGNKKLDQHHLGSRHYVSQLSEADKQKIIGMASIDVVGFGTKFKACSLGRGSRATCDLLIAHAKELGVSMTYKKAPEWSDHEPFEKAGIPSAWLFCEKDPTYHTMGDVVEHLQPENIKFIGNLLATAIEGLGK